jgi:hypothetical protein
MFAMVNNDEIEHLAEDAEARLTRVIKALG